MLMQAVLWFEQGKFEETRPEISRAIDVYETLRSSGENCWRGANGYSKELKEKTNPVTSDIW